MTRILLPASCVALIVAVACGGSSPTSPSSNGAPVAGSVVGAGDSPEPSTAASSALTLSDAPDQAVSEAQVATDGMATALREGRGNSEGKVVLCHRTGNGYHSIDVSVNAEPAHRAHGDARPGEPVPGDTSRTFDNECRVASASPVSPVDIEKFTNGQDADQAPGPTIRVGRPVLWTYVVTNHSAVTFSSVSVTDDRGVAIACPRLLLSPGASMTCTASGVAAAGQDRSVGTVRATVPGAGYTDSDASHYFGSSAPVLTFAKYTNGQDVSQAPGPSLRVGSTVSWTYVVTNTSNMTFASVSVTDDRGVAVACPRQLLSPGASMTCTASGLAVAGQYRNVGTVVAAADGVLYVDSDESFYLGVN